MNWISRIGQSLRYRLTHASKFPKGDLVSFFERISKQGFRPQHIVDVGANHAKWSRKAHAVFPDCNFTLIEPQRELATYLDRFCQKASNSQWIEAGAGAEPGELPLTIFPDTVSSGFAYSKEKAESLGRQQRIVPIVTLNDIVRQRGLGCPEMVKIDAEGFEPQVLHGASDLIGHTEVFLLEACFMPPPENWMSLVDILHMMTDFGYELFDFTSFQRINGIMALGEIAFVRQNGFFRSAENKRFDAAA